MPDVGIRELKARASQIVRQVREERARYIITCRGRPVALLTPLEPGQPLGIEATPEADASAWEELTQLGEEIGRGWQASVTSAELLLDMRR